MVIMGGSRQPGEDSWDVKEGWIQEGDIKEKVDCRQVDNHRNKLTALR